MKKQLITLLLVFGVAFIQPATAGVVFEAQANIYSGDLVTTGGMAVGGRVNKIDWAVYTKDWGWRDQGHVWRVLSREPMIFQFYYDGASKDATLYIYNKDISASGEAELGLSKLDLKINGKSATLSDEISDDFGVGGDKGDVTKYLQKGLNVIEIKSGNPQMKHVVQKVLIRYFD